MTQTRTPNRRTYRPRNRMDPTVRNEFTLRGRDDFVRLDTLCASLLRRFFEWMQAREGGMSPPGRASVLVHAADRYLRDFVVDIKERGPADQDSTLVRQYLGNWYIIHTLTPSHEEIDRIAEALQRLYAYLAEAQIVSRATADSVAQALRSTDFFHARLEAFWNLTPDTIPVWRQVDDYRRQKPWA
jgi:O-acetyl-ADP-ribose deacetylase (regulator of RNase III)